MAIGGVVINWASKTRDAVKDTDRLARSVSDVGDKAKRSGGLLGNVGKAATAGIAGVGLVAAGAAVAFVDMAKAAYGDKQAQDKLVRTLDRVKGVTKKAADATGSWVDKMELATLVSDDELRVALGNLTLATGDLSEAQKLAALAQDAAVGSGREFAGIAVAMGKAADGNTAALQKMFPFLDAGPDKVLTLAEAMQQLTDKFGGAAEAAAGNDVFGRLGVAWGQIKEAIGGVALPLLEKLSGWFADPANVALIEEWIGKLQTWATQIGTDIRDKLQEFIDWLNSPEGKQAMADFVDRAEAIRDAIGDIAKAIQNLIGWIESLTGAWADMPQWMKDLMGAGGYNDVAERRARAKAGLTPSPETRPRTGGASAQSTGTTVNIYNPKPERATTSVAAALRVERPAHLGGGFY